MTVGLDIKALLEDIHVVLIHNHPKLQADIQTRTSFFSFGNFNGMCARLWWLCSYSA